MLDLIAIALLCALAVALNTYAAYVADRSTARRARLEAAWGSLIAARDREAA